MPWRLFVGSCLANLLGKTGDGQKLAAKIYGAMMQVYLVGGAVRDALLGLPIGDQDFVVVGATGADLLAQGFCQVGADFPVFLHPISKNEYALARRERKNGNGHRGFSVDSSQTVSLRDDLLRRDLTINALAMPVAGLFDERIVGKVLDFYGGLEDLHKRCLRHISPAFAEDPLRVLRVARFYAKFFAHGFFVHDDTKQLMQKMAGGGALATLSRERIWAESVKAMGQPCGFAYWQLLFDLAILPELLPALAALWQNDGLKQCTFALLKNNYKRPSHYQFALLMSGFFADHSHQSIAEINACADALNAPKQARNFTVLLAEFCQSFAWPLNAQTLLALIHRTKAVHNAGQLNELIDICYEYLNAFAMPPALSKTQTTALLAQALAIYQGVRLADIDANLTGAAIGQALETVRMQRLTQLLNEQPSTGVQ